MKRQNLTDQSINIVVARLSLPLGAFIILVFIGLISDRLLGEYALITTYYFVLQTLPLLGLTPYYMREVARSQPDAGHFFVTAGILSLLACALINLCIHFALPASGYSPEVQEAIFWVGLATAPGILAFIAEITLTSLQQSKAVPRIAIFENAIRVVASIAILYFAPSVLNLVIVLVASRIVSLFCYLSVLVRLKVLTTESRICRRFISGARAVLPVFLLNSMLVLILSRLDFILISFLGTIEVIGYYAIAYRLFEIVGIASNAVISAIYPYWARTFEVNKALFIRHLRVFSSLTFFVTLCAGAFAFCLAEWYVGLLFPSQFPEPVVATQLFMLLLVPMCIDQILTQGLNAANQQDKDTRVLTFSAPLYALSVIVFFPLFGLVGAVLANGIVLLFQVALRFFWLQKTVKHQIFSKAMLFKYFFAYCALGLAGIAALDTGVASESQFVLSTLLIVTIVLLMTKALRPIESMSVFFTPRAKHKKDIENFGDLMLFIAYDYHRNAIWWRRKMGSKKPINNLGFLACWLIRCSRLCHNKQWLRLARAIWHFNMIVTKCDIRPSIKIGPGLVLDAPVAVGVTADLGNSNTFFAHSALGCSGSANVGAGIGIPHIGDKVVFRPRAYILGGIQVDNFADVEAHAQIIKARQIEKY